MFAKAEQRGNADVQQAVLVVDLHTRTCAVLQAFVQVSNSWAMPADYWDLTDTPRINGLNVAVWAREHMDQWMSSAPMLGNLSIRGVALPPEVQVDSTLLQNPTLALCTSGQSSNGTPGLLRSFEYLTFSLMMLVMIMMTIIENNNNDINNINNSNC